MLSIIIPFYNENQNVERLFNKANKLYSEFNDLEFIFINNGSTDDTLEKLNYFKSKFLNLPIFILNIDKNIGYGNGIYQGLIIAHGEYLAWTHSDLQTDLNDIFLGFKIYLSKNNKNIIVKGSRINRSILDSFFSKLMEIFVFLFLQTYINEINAQPKIFHKSLLFHLLKYDIPKDFSFDLFFLYHGKKLCEIISFDVYFHERKFNSAKGGGSLIGKLKLIRRTILYILKFKN